MTQWVMPIFLDYLTAVFSITALFISIFLFFRLRVLLFKYDNKPLLETLNKIVHDLAEKEKHIKNNTRDIEAIINNLKFCFQKMSIIRFNPFNETGGSQSFVIALLNKDNDGVILTALHARERTRIYTKEIINGKSTLELSSEEKNALVKAVKNRV